MNMCHHVVSHRCQVEVVVLGMVPKPMTGIPRNWRWWTFHVLCTSAKVKVIDRVDHIRVLMVLLVVFCGFPILGLDRSRSYLQCVAGVGRSQML